MTTLEIKPAKSAGKSPSTTGSGLAAQFARALEPVVGGALPVHLTLWDGSSAGPADAPRVVVRSPRALRRLFWHPGELGAAQAYVTSELEVEGDLDEALTHVWGVAHERGLSGIRLTPSALADLAKLARSAGVLGRPLSPPASQAVVRGRLHSLGRDRAVISHHYDLSNDFYALILDPHLSYSCAYWRSDDPDYTLQDAQRDKFELVGRKLGLREGSRLLDVGCGWGSMSLYAAEHFGAQVTGVTISAEQKRFADNRIRERGLEDRVEIRLQDYRDVREDGFDAVVSLEMGEHVGEKNYATYARVLHDAVRPGGRVLVQQMSRRGRHPGGGPFIESFIAPDMTMRPVGETVALLEDAGLEVRDVHALREHYVRTVAAWHDTFEANHDRVVELVGEEVARVWRLYLVGGAMAFRDGRMGVDQILSVRPHPNGAADVEPARPQGWS
ncbi:SAM-dependent methyltransferase [Knoellia koreensis]|uniref:Class I SAM-dependent methyltransferase n=1 Tax=Knoellia koreensis TaxID=2730921 RepID=A0A849HFB7_9MICO|nr:cyclopropane-fatty-acyl-phospholipid synthase family protein [Knoellia sp. DB2414S]NNM45819.1 class I SAM-dependent methyltransferase [Knoellia sp. DB2414S]